MKTDLYTKTVLTIIAFCLVVIVIKDADIMPKAHAATPNTALPLGVNYGLVPLNPDGSIDVNFPDKIDVNIVGINTWDELDVNIDEVGGTTIRGYLPVINK